MPEQTVVTYPVDFMRRHPEKSYWIRIEMQGGVAGVDLDGAATLPAAVQLAFRMGHRPTHWADSRGFISRLPESIVPNR